jgi:hypothetical protein
MLVSRSLRIVFVTLASLSLAGCGFLFESKAERATRNSPNFKSGYSDGCATANAQGTDYDRTMVRDDEMYRTDKPYRAGWAAGVSSCRSNLAAQPGVPGSPIPDNSPGHSPGR